MNVRASRISVRWIELIARAISLCIVSGQLMASSCDLADAPNPLSKNISVLASIEPNSHNSYSLEISGRSFVRVELEQDAPDLVVCIVSPERKRIRSAQSGFAGEFTTSFAAYP